MRARCGGLTSCRARYGGGAFEAAAAGVQSEEVGVPTESYSVVHRLTGHDSDVNSLEWSADGRMLASCGLDGQVLIWDAGHAYGLLRRLETEPRRSLKGLVWDPLGKYIAAQSSEGHVFIWRMHDWRLQTVLTAPYAEPSESYTYFSRPSWSPDGRVLCVPDAINGAESVALLVERHSWSCEQNLVGHSSSVQVAVASAPTPPLTA